MDFKEGSHGIFQCNIRHLRGYCDEIHNNFKQISFLGCDAMPFGKQAPTFQRNLLSPSSGYPEDGGKSFFQNITTYPPNYMVLHHR
jgi:hypothetical protein